LEQNNAALIGFPQASHHPTIPLTGTCEGKLKGPRHALARPSFFGGALTQMLIAGLLVF
jgi:hypothetical protein